MGEYAKSLLSKLNVTQEEQTDDIVQRSISGMDAAERRQSLDILKYRAQLEMRLKQIRQAARQQTREKSFTLRMFENE